MSKKNQVMISILALGSRGDVLPLAALGKGLLQAGHQVRLVTFENFRDTASSRGLAFHPLQGDGKELTGRSGGFIRAAGRRNVLNTWRGIQESFGTLAESLARDLSDPVLRDSDLIINQLPGGLYGMDLAEKLQVPMLQAAVIPMIRTRTRPMPPFPTWLSFLPGYNLLTYRAAERLVWSGFGRVINRWRREVLQLPEKAFPEQFSRLGTSRYPILNGFSPAVVSSPDDWGNHVHLTGWWFPREPDWEPSRELVNFLQAGPKPVFIGFGSMTLPDAKSKLSLILRALEQTGQRAVLLKGWGDLIRSPLPETVLAIDYAPYSWLFPQMAAVIHHGGSGTTGFALRSGVPSLVIPFVFDQFYWGSRVEKLGVGPAPIPISKLTAEGLGSAIRDLVTNPDYIWRAGDLGAVLARENGVQAAVEIIHQYLFPG